MKKGIGKTISIITILTITFQLILPMISELKVLAANETTEADLKISSKEELISFANDVNSGNTYKGKIVVLMNDIDLGGNENNQWTPIGIGDGFYDGFEGTFDGQSYKISGMYLNNTELESQGFFATNCGTIKNLQIINSTIKDGNNYTGLIAGRNVGGTIENCSTLGCTMTITTGYIYATERTYISAGGIVGANWGTIRNCKNSAIITCNNDVSDINDIIFIGGIAGEQGYETEILNCSNTGNIVSDGAVGGIVGSATAANNSIINCYNSGNISAKEGKKQSYIAGICGEDASYIKNCYNLGNILSKGVDISSQSAAGGIVASDGDSQPIEMCYNKGKVESTRGNAGGIVGRWCESKNIKACFNAGEIKAYMYGAGIKVSNTGTIESCYNIGKVSLNSTASGPSVGAIVNSNTGLSGTTKVNGTIKNCYYQNDSCSKGVGDSAEAGNGKPISKTATEMKAATFVEQLNQGGTYFAEDTKNTNNGYPVLIYDTTAPTVNVEYSTKEPTNKNVTVTITSNEEIQEVEGWTLSSDKKVLIKEYSANTKETITIKDLAGNESQANIEIGNIDKTGPSVDVEYSTKEPTNKNVTVTITSSEEIQEVEGWTLSSDKKVLTKEYTENTKETITVKDLAENETQANIEISNIDKTAPNGKIEYSTKNPTKENVTVTITSNEEIQEVEGWTLSSDKKVLIKEYSANTKETITIKDLAGNESQANIEIGNIDKTGPSVDVEYSTKEPTNKNVTVTITSSEEIQEVEGWTLSSDKKVLTKEYTENTKETITVKDLAGNEVQVNIEIANIDKTLPDITIGDINQDEKIDVTDLLMLKRHLVAGSRESWKITGDSLLVADMNEDGNVDVTDMLMLKRKIVNNM